MKQSQILMPMGGLGSRFTDAGYTTPKPLIEVDGKAMFLRALDSFKGAGEASYIFVIRREHDDTYDLKNEIIRRIPDASVVVLDGNTRGAVETCLKAEPFINDSDALVVADCDIYFESEAYFKLVAEDAVEGALLTFESNDPRYSYVELDDSGKAIRTAEKVVISSHAILGGYYFATGSLFKALAHEFVDNPLPENLKEYYLSHLFNLMISGGKNVAIAPVDTKHIFGTPEELNAYLNGTE